MRVLAIAGVLAAVLSPASVGARAPGEAVRLVWMEGDVAGFTSIYAPDGDERIGVVEYRQVRRGDVLSATRIARFRDGSSDEDTAEARVGATLEALRGRSIVRDPQGEVIADLTIDVVTGRIEGAWTRGDRRRTLDKRVALPPGTYWGPLIFLVAKNFDANAEDGRLVFRTVAATPRPMVLDMELVHDGETVIDQAAGTVRAARLELRPTIPWVPDVLARLVAPRTTLWIRGGTPPALARFSGPRNFTREEIRIE